LSSDHMNTYDSVGKFRTRLSVRETNGGQCVERLKEYQQAWQMSALQCFISDLEKSWNLSWYDDRREMFLFYVLEGETFVSNVRFKIFRRAMQ
jgi:hypothetical protein